MRKDCCEICDPSAEWRPETKSEFRVKIERETNKMQQIRWLLSNFYLNMFRASLCPSSGVQDRVMPHMVFCTGCAGCSWLWLCGAVWNVWRCTQLATQLHTTTTNHSQHNQCRTPQAGVHGLVLLMIGIMMAETCSDRSLIINIGFVASCWFLSLHATFMMHGHKNLKTEFFWALPQKSDQEGQERPLTLWPLTTPIVIVPNS